MVFSMGRTWSESFGLLRERWSDLLIVVLGFHVVAAMLAVSFMAEFFSLIDPAADPEIAAQQMMALMPRIMGLSMLANLIQLAGYGATVAVLGPERPALGPAILAGVKATPTLLLAIVFLLVGFYIAFIVAIFVFGLAIVAMAGAASSQSDLAATAGGPMVVLFVIAYFALFAGAGYLAMRFVTLLPVAVIERQYNPFTLLGRAWNLTRGHGWKIFGFFLLLWIPLMVVYFVIIVSVVGSLVRVDGQMPTLEAFVPLWAIMFPLGIATTMLFSAIVVSIHGQLAETAPDDA